MKKNKKEKKEDVFETQCWAYEIIEDPYQVFAQCYDFAGIDNYRKLIRNTLLSVYDNKVYKKLEPSSTLYEYSIILSVLNVAYYINRQNKKEAINFFFGDKLDSRYYCEGEKKEVDWECFPRFLSMKEYENPYLVFKHIFQYQDLGEWKKDLQEVIERTLSSYNEDMFLEILPIYLHLSKLMEAAHLINVREVTHIKGYFKGLRNNQKTESL